MAREQIGQPALVGDQIRSGVTTGGNQIVDACVLNRWHTHLSHLVPRNRRARCKVSLSMVVTRSLPVTVDSRTVP